MKLTSLLLALTALSVRAMARNCIPWLTYCGTTLLEIGDNYQPQIDQCLFDNEQPLINDGKQDLFMCMGGRNGVLKWIGHCQNSCVDGGQGDSDHCSNQLGFGMEKGRGQKELKREPLTGDTGYIPSAATEKSLASAV
ncbi:MAG: hypothetical protein M1839_007297 [Geoglossum umbratile]|nr:MAG: hypothetical protein M1839_007297 [Geoglossum umbratile]